MAKPAIGKGTFYQFVGRNSRALARPSTADQGNVILNNSAITILKGTQWKPISTLDATVISFEDLKFWIRNKTFWRHLFQYQAAQLATSRLEALTKPLLTALLIRLLTRGRCDFLDEIGNCQRINSPYLARKLAAFLNDYGSRRSLIKRVREEVSSLLNGARRSHLKLNLDASPVYLRTDLAFGLRSGGSVGHIAGVLNQLGEFAGPPILLTTDWIPTVSSDIETRLLPPSDRFWDFRELPSLDFNRKLCENIQCQLAGRRTAFLYQRYCLNNYAGVKVSEQLGIPFILEYNGSEVWINRHWGDVLKYDKLSEDIEGLNLKKADLVVVVSDPLRSELLERGVEDEKILVNPNGVDPERYSPDVEGLAVRRQYDLECKATIGFIGTFGKWHGAEVLAEAFGLLLQRYPMYRDRVWLMLMGDGMTMPQVRQKLEEFQVVDRCTLTGLLPQEKGPSYLAACDILVSPHVPNSDGTRFFGSPTKLFEYMAMGKGIVASDLDQIGEVLRHDETAWMVKPGDAESLMAGLKALVDDSARRLRLGEAARKEVVAKYTWREHTRKIIEKLKERCR